HPRDVVLDPGGLAFRPDPALREPLLDGRPGRADRHHHGLVVLGHPGVRAGAAAWTGGPDCRRVLRARVRPGRAGGGSPGTAGGPHQHLDRLPADPVPAPAGVVDRLPAPAPRASGGVKETTIAACSTGCAAPLKKSRTSPMPCCLAPAPAARSAQPATSTS